MPYVSRSKVNAWLQAAELTVDDKPLIAKMRPVFVKMEAIGILGESPAALDAFATDCGVTSAELMKILKLLVVADFIEKV